MKNKQKQWRRSARSINRDEGRKHQGRRYKTVYQNIGKFPSALLQKLFSRLNPVDIDTDK